MAEPQAKTVQVRSNNMYDYNFGMLLTRTGGLQVHRNPLPTAVKERLAARLHALAEEISAEALKERDYEEAARAAAEAQPATAGAA